MTGIEEAVRAESALGAWLAPGGDAMGRGRETILCLESFGGQTRGERGEEAR